MRTYIHNFSIFTFPLIFPFTMFKPPVLHYPFPLSISVLMNSQATSRPVFCSWSKWYWPQGRAEALFSSTKNKVDPLDS